MSLSVTFPIDAKSCIAHSYLTLSVSLSTHHGITHKESVILRLLSLFCASSGQTAYSHNPFLGQKPLSLESQLQLPMFLNVRPSVYKTGIVLCCDTARGVLVVSNLIKQWRGGFLWIVISSSPENFTKLMSHSEESSSLDYDGKLSMNTSFVELFQELCATTTTGLSCIISSHSPDEDLATLMSPLQVAFIYVDVYREYYTYLTALYRMRGSRKTSCNDLGNKNVVLRVYRYSFLFPYTYVVLYF